MGDEPILQWKIVPPPFIVYCARPISGCKHQEVVNYYKRVGVRLSKVDIQVLTPIYAKEHLNHAIKNRARWMVRKSDIVFINLTGAIQLSIGSIMELAWADAFGIHSIIVLDENDIHRHAFVLDCADIVFPEEEMALIYLEKLASGILD